MLWFKAPRWEDLGHANPAGKLITPVELSSPSRNVLHKHMREIPGRRWFHSGDDTPTQNLACLYLLSYHVKIFGVSLKKMMVFWWMSWTSHSPHVTNCNMHMIISLIFTPVRWFSPGLAWVMWQPWGGDNRGRQNVDMFTKRICFAQNGDEYFKSSKKTDKNILISWKQQQTTFFASGGVC